MELLAGLGGHLGRSWRPLWASCGRLGRSWAVLEASWGPLGRLKSFWTQQGRVSGQTNVPKGGQDGAQMGAKVCQNRTQNGSKSKTKTKTKKEALEDRLGAVLGRSWVVLGAVLGSFSCSRSSRGYILKNQAFEKRRPQETTWCRSWVDLGAQEAPKWRPRRVKK